MRSNELKYIVIPKSVVKRGTNSFEGCNISCVYYEGNKIDFDQIEIYGSVNSGNGGLMFTKYYFYSETEPDKNEDDLNNYWHYIDGKPVIW